MSHSHAPVSRFRRWLAAAAAALQIAAPGALAFHEASHASADSTAVIVSELRLEQPSLHDRTAAAAECVLCQAASGSRHAAPPPSLLAEAGTRQTSRFDQTVEVLTGIDARSRLSARAPPASSLHSI